MLACLILCLAGNGCSPNASAPKATVSATAEPAVLRVTYFHRNIRCPSCEKIESLAHKTVSEGYAGPLADGRMQWSAVNLDVPGNGHYEADYKLEAQSVVLSEMRGGKEVRWKNLDKVWDLLTDDAALVKYIQDEIREFGKPTSQE